MPQTRKSPNGGRRRSRTTGRFLIWPSAWGSGARAIYAYRRLTSASAKEKPYGEISVMLIAQPALRV